MSGRFSKADLKRYRREIMKKGMQVNRKLTDLLAGKNVTISTIVLPQDDKPGLKPEEKVRLFLDLIVRAQHRLGTEAFGKCVECDTEFPKGALDDTPWLETCGDCAATEGEWL